MESVIRKWGNSPALRLPSAVLKAAGYSLEQKVEITVSPGRIVIEPSDKVQYVLADMLNAIDDGNTHGEVCFGPPVGKEVM
jgi:antitoxin MazE